MKEIKEKILKMIKEKPSHYNIKNLAKELKMTKTSDLVKLNRVIKELEEDFLIQKDGKNQAYQIKEAELLKGIISINKAGTGFIDVDENLSYRIAGSETMGAMDKDEVSYKVVDKEAIIVKILTRRKTRLVLTYHVNNKSKYFTCDDNRVSNEIIVLDEADYHLVDGSKLLAKISKYPSGKNSEIHCSILTVLGHQDDPGVDIEAVLLSHDVKTIFEYETLQQANSIEQEITENDIEGRIDLRNEFTCTIDGDDSKDFDDAIGIIRHKKGYNLKVSIADVSYYVTEGSPLDIEARERGTSVYVVNKVVPMLPHVLSNGICSLNPNVDRLTLTCDMNLDNEGNVINFKVYPSVINSDYRMTYSNVNKIFDGDFKTQKKYQKVLDKFFDMLELSKKIRKKRSFKGAIDFDRDEANIILDEDGKVIDIKLRDRGESERVIEDFMILANECVASLTNQNKIPSLYRIHDKPNANKTEKFMKLAGNLGYHFKSDPSEVKPFEYQACLNHFKDSDEFPVISTMMLRSMAKARYEDKCLGHFGLGSEEYCHFTSPIRRYPDLIVHRYLRKYHFENQKIANEDLKTVKELGLETSVAERIAVDAERAVNDLKKAEYMLEHIGENFNGIISSVTNFGMFIELSNTVEGLVRLTDLNDDYYRFDADKLQLLGERTGKIYTLGQRVRVKCMRVDKTARSVDFVLLQNRKKKSRSNKRRSVKRWI